MISIIIPTLNEEDYLPALLGSIKKQNFKDCETIVADAGSKDKTIEIAQKYGCIIVPGGLPARGRNNGAKEARGDVLFFLDADTVLPNDFLKKSIREFISRKLTIASFCFDTKSKRKIFHSLVAVYNEIVIFLEERTPFSIIGVLIKKDVFEKIGGYDESLKIGEDRDLGRKALKYGKFGLIRSAEIFISERRFVKDGWMVTIIKCLLSELHTMFIGPVKSDIFKYKFNHYKDEKSE